MRFIINLIAIATIVLAAQPEPTTSRLTRSGNLESFPSIVGSSTIAQGPGPIVTSVTTTSARQSITTRSTVIPSSTLTSSNSSSTASLVTSSITSIISAPQSSSTVTTAVTSAVESQGVPQPLSTPSKSSTESLSRTGLLTVFGLGLMVAL